MQCLNKLKRVGELKLKLVVVTSVNANFRDAFRFALVFLRRKDEYDQAVFKFSPDSYKKSLIKNTGFDILKSFKIFSYS